MLEMNPNFPPDRIWVDLPRHQMVDAHSSQIGFLLQAGCPAPKRFIEVDNDGAMLKKALAGPFLGAADELPPAARDLVTRRHCQTG